MVVGISGDVGGLTFVPFAQTKSYYVREDDDGEMELEKAEGTSITWKGGKNPTVKVFAPLDWQYLS